MKPRLKIEHETSGYGIAFFRIVDEANNIKGDWAKYEFAAHLRAHGKLYVAFSDFYTDEVPTEQVLVLCNLAGESV